MSQSSEERMREALQGLVDTAGVAATRRVVTATVLFSVLWIACLVAGVMIVFGGPVGWVALGVGGVMLLGVPAAFRRFDTELARFED